jgi:hypothetical protein
MALLTCDDCGGQVSSRAAFCPHCGGPVRTGSGSPGTAAAPPTPPRRLPIELFSVAGFSSLTLEQSVTLGRTRANLLVEHPDVAATHCRLTPRDDHWEVDDVGGRGVYASPNRQMHALLFGGGVVDVGGFPGAVGLALPGVLDVPVPLRMRSPGAPDATLQLEKLPMIMGRAPWVDLPLADRNVSHAHARLRLENGRVMLDDLGSRNGTFVGDVRIQTGHMLRVGERIRLGETELVFGEPKDASSDQLETDPSLPLSGRRTEGPLRAPVIATTRPALEAGSVRVPAGRDGGCPACHAAFELKRGGVVAVHDRASAAPRARSRIGHCSHCGVRLACCPSCGSANAAPQLVSTLACRDCSGLFEAR